MTEKCAVCGNTETLPDGQCSYCVWRGDAGPGLVLKKIIRKVRLRPEGDIQNGKENSTGGSKGVVVPY